MANVPKKMKYVLILLVLIDVTVKKDFAEIKNNYVKLILKVSFIYVEMCCSLCFVESIYLIFPFFKFLAKDNQDWISAENLLKFISYFGLFAIGIFIFYITPQPKYIIMLAIAIAAALCIEYYYPENTEDDFKNDLN